MQFCDIRVLCAYRIKWGDVCIKSSCVQTYVKTQGQVKAIAVCVVAPQKDWLYFRFCVKHIF